MSVDTLPCPDAPHGPEGVNYPHHPMPRLGELVCVHCHNSAERIIKTTPLLHKPWLCSCDSCYRSRTVLCGSCHLSFDVHPRELR